MNFSSCSRSWATSPAGSMPRARKIRIRSLLIPGEVK